MQNTIAGHLLSELLCSRNACPDGNVGDDQGQADDSPKSLQDQNLGLCSFLGVEHLREEQ